MALTEKEQTVIRCAYADLIGALQAQQNCDVMSHDWEAHQLSIDEMAEAFDFLEEQD